MNRYEQTALWQKTLAPQLEPDLESNSRAILRNAFESFRERASILAGEIAISLPDFTVHDISHIDALWEMAQLIAGENFVLTPPEAFVLGGAFLIHDLGMGLAAYPNGIEELRKEKMWQDTVAAILRNQLNRPATSDEIQNASKEVIEQTIQIVLREIHANQAEHLALSSWRDNANNIEYHLIENVALRQSYGTIIGKIAYSHWWSLDKLHQNFSELLGAPAGFSNDWTVDPLKIACLLRVADAAHLDDRRAPSFLKVIRKPSQVSKDHWIFQEKLYQPRLDVDRLVYTSKTPFTIAEANAWWLCFDAVQMIDLELRHVDALLADAKRFRFNAKGVSYADEPRRLSKLITTIGWEPVDARIKVGNVAKLISNLGGEELYGKNVIVPLRELIQNGCDAVIARRLLENHPDDWGSICVRHGIDEKGTWIEVEDTGIGMSIDVLTGPFLDFGTSFWGSNLMHKELPGLEAKGFRSTGKYGVGFFSVFMWGERVQVFSRRPERAREETWVLEFSQGLISRPILRKALSSEHLMDGGTRVRVWFKNPDLLENLILLHSRNQSWTLEHRCAWLCPALNVTLFTETNGKTTKVLSAYDWTKMKSSDLLKRILGPVKIKNKKLNEELKNVANNFRLIKDRNGDIIGRACIAPAHDYRIIDNEEYYGRGFPEGIVTVGGFRTTDITGILGILVGKSVVAARNVGIPVAEGDILGNWASEQAKLVQGCFSEPKQLAELSQIIVQCGGDTAELPVARNEDGWASFNDIITSQSLKLENEVILVQDAAVHLREDKHGTINLHKNVYVVHMGWIGILQTYQMDDWSGDWPPSATEYEYISDPLLDQWEFLVKSLEGTVLNAISKAWSLPLNEMLKRRLASKDDYPVKRVIGMDQNNNPITLSVNVVRKLE